MDRLIAMQTFALVAELASFSKAAEALQVPKATVPPCQYDLRHLPPE